MADQGRSEPIRVYVCYDQANLRWAAPGDAGLELVPWLDKSLTHENVEIMRAEAKLRPRVPHSEAARAAIAETDIALVVLTEGLFADDFVRYSELPKLIERAEEGLLRLVPVLVEPCEWACVRNGLDRFQFANAAPLVTNADDEAQWYEARFAILRFLVTAVGEYCTQQRRPVPGQSTPKNFVCYAVEDRPAVWQYISQHVMDGMHGLQGVAEEGMDCDDEWKRQIDQSDLVILFWSRAAKASTRVEKQWRYALDQKGTDCIRPIAIGEPPLAEPPPELRHLDFILGLSKLEQPAVPSAEGQTEAASSAMGHLIFISAKSEDNGYAERVYEFLVGNGLRVFFSRESLPAMGDADYRRQIDHAIDEAAHMVLVTTSHERATSRWVEREWGLFDNELSSGRKTGNLLSVITGGMTIAELPLTLRGKEVLPLSDEGLERLLAFVKDPPHPAGTIGGRSPRGLPGQPFTPTATVNPGNRPGCVSGEPPQDARGVAAGEATPPLHVQPASGNMVFIASHSDDREAAERIYDLLCSRRLGVFYPPLSTSVDRSGYGSEVEDALQETTHMVVVTSSRDHVTSRWVHAEWESFASGVLAGERGGSLVTVLVGEMRRGDLPISLRACEVVRLTDEGLERLLKLVGASPK